MKFRLLFQILIFTCCLSKANAQDTARLHYGVQFRYQPVDFFVGIGSIHEKNNLQHELQLNFGVNSTFFQRRIYPQISYRFTWLPLNKRWIQIGPAVLTNLATRHFNKASAHGFSFEEQFLGGFSVGCGERSRFRLTLASGLAIEQNWSTFSGRYKAFYSWTIMGEISYHYAF